MTDIFLKIAGMSATACLVAAIVLVLRLLLKPAPKAFSYVLWAAVFIRLLCPVSIPLPTAEVSPITPLQIRTEQYTYDKNINNAAPMSADVSEKLEISIYTDNNIPEYKAPKTALEIISAIWLSGALIMIIRWIYSFFRLKGQLKAACPLDGNVFVSDNIQTPFIFGIIKPKIYIPAELPESRRRLIILHEKYHIRRLDHIAKIIMYAALCIHWFNPLVWLSFSLCERDMEMSCDEAVTGKMSRSETADYSEALLEAAPHKAAGFTAGFSESSTGKRIKNILKFKKPALWIILVCAVIAAVSVIVLCSDSAPKAPDNSENAPSSESPNLFKETNSDTFSVCLVTKSRQKYEFSKEDSDLIFKIMKEWECTETSLYEHVPSEFDLMFYPKSKPHSYTQISFAPAKNENEEPIFSGCITSMNSEHYWSIPEESYRKLRDIVNRTYEKAEAELNVPLSIPIITATPEFLESVYFGSEFPYLLYATEGSFVFTDGMNGLYLCFDHSVEWAADIGSSFEAVSSNLPFKPGGPGWNGISMGAFTDENGIMKMWCSITRIEANEADKTLNYVIDLETNTMNYIDSIPSDSRSIKGYKYFDFSEGSSQPYDNRILRYNDSPDEYAYIGLNQPPVFTLSMIKLVRHTSDGITELVPFPQNSPALDPEARSKIHFGTYYLDTSEGINTLCRITIYPWGTVNPVFTPLSSFWLMGTAELNDDNTKLILKLSDGGRYVFDINGDRLIYRQSESDESVGAVPKEMGGAYEGAEYVFTEE